MVAGQLGALSVDAPVRARARGLVVISPVVEEQAQGRALRHPAILIAALVGLATMLRLPTLTRAYWVDEGISIGIASHHLAQIPGLLGHDGSPPLFYVILHFWLRFFGTSEISTHTLSLLLSLAVIPVAWWCAESLFGPSVAMWAAVLAATNPFLNWYATETRMYPLVCGIAMVAITLAVRAVRRHNLGDATWAVVAFAALLYTHDWAVYLVAVTSSVLFVRAALRRDWPQALAVAGAALAIAVAYLPWLPTFLFQARHTAAPWAVSPSLGDLFSDPSSVLGGTMGVIVEPLFAIGVVVALRHPDDRAQAWKLVGGVGLLTLAAGWIAAQVEPSWTSRYLAVALGPLLIAVAGALAPNRTGRRIMTGVTVLLVLWSIVGSLLPDPNAPFAKSNVAAVATAARPYLRPGDLVVVTQTEQLAVTAHYLRPYLRFSTPTGPTAHPHVVDWRDLVRRLSQADPCRTIAPQVDALAPGAHVLVVNPLKRVGALGTRWSRTVNTQVKAVNELLARDPGLTLTASFAPATRPKPFSAVTGLVYTKDEGRAPCP